MMFMLSYGEKQSPPTDHIWLKWVEHDTMIRRINEAYQKIKKGTLHMYLYICVQGNMDKIKQLKVLKSSGMLSNMSLMLTICIGTIPCPSPPLGLMKLFIHEQVA